MNGAPRKDKDVKKIAHFEAMLYDIKMLTGPGMSIKLAQWQRVCTKHAIDKSWFKKDLGFSIGKTTVCKLAGFVSWRLRF